MNTGDVLDSQSMSNFHGIPIQKKLVNNFYQVWFFNKGGDCFFMDGFEDVTDV